MPSKLAVGYPLVILTLPASEHKSPFPDASSTGGCANPLLVAQFAAAVCPSRASAAPWTNPAVELNEPYAACNLAVRASDWALINRGMATAARIPIIVITTTNSINVNPDECCELCIKCLPEAQRTAMRNDWIGRSEAHIHIKDLFVRFSAHIELKSDF
jgi:hypothetical protein